MSFNYVKYLDAVGTLYQEAAVRYVDALRAENNDEAERFRKAADAIKAAWPELVKEALAKPLTER